MSEVRFRVRSQAAEATDDRAVSFALAETKQTSRDAALMELVLAKGDWLRIPGDEATFRLVLSLLREQK